MAKPNYSYEKRQRELAKKKKKEEKAREKAERKTQPGGDDVGSDGTPQGGEAASTAPAEGQGAA